MKNVYKKHLFFCVQLKDAGRKCCSQGGSMELAAYAKARLKELNLHGEGKMRVSQSGCLGRCNNGPNLLIYPDGVWYTFANQADIDEIIEVHLLKGQIVERLISYKE